MHCMPIPQVSFVLTTVIDTCYWYLTVVFFALFSLLFTVADLCLDWNAVGHTRAPTARSAARPRHALTSVVGHGPRAKTSVQTRHSSKIDSNIWRTWSCRWLRSRNRTTNWSTLTLLHKRQSLAMIRLLLRVIVTLNHPHTILWLWRAQKPVTLTVLTGALSSKRFVFGVKCTHQNRPIWTNSSPRQLKGVREYIDEQEELEDEDGDDDLSHESTPALLSGLGKFLTKEELLVDIPPRSVADRLISRLLKTSEPGLCECCLLACFNTRRKT